MLHDPVRQSRKVHSTVFVALLALAAFLIRLWGMSKLHYWDEMAYLQNAQVICCGKLNYSELDFRPPLLSVILAGVFLVWHHIYAACIVTAALNAVGPVFLFFAGRRTVGSLPGATAAFLLALSPFFVGIFPDNFVTDDTGNSLLTDSPALSLVILSFWLLLRALERPTPLRFVRAGFSLSLCILMRFGSIPSVAILLLLPLFSPVRWKSLGACMCGLATGLVPYLVWSKVTYGGFLSTIRAGWRNVEGPVQPFLFFFHHATTIFTPTAIAGLLIALVWQLHILLHPSRTRYANAASPNPTLAPHWIRAWLWLWLALGVVFFSFMPHKEPRYIMPLTAPVLLLGGLGLSLYRGIPNKLLRVSIGCCIAASLVGTLLPLTSRLREPFVNPVRPEEELAAQELEARVPHDVTLYMSFNYPIWAYYSNHRIQELSGIGPDLYREMAQIPPGEVLIIYREAEAASQSDIAWVDGSGRFTRIATYSTFVIYRRGTANSQAEFKERIAQFARTLPKGAWLRNGLWDHQRWNPPVLPNHQLIDDVSGDHPAFLWRLDGHMALVNAQAMRLAGIDQIGCPG